MARFGKAAAVLTAAETARQWARSNPDKASSYIDKATGFVDQRTGGKYHSRIDSLSRNAKKSLTGRDTVTGSTADSETPSARRTFPDGRL